MCGMREYFPYKASGEIERVMCVEWRKREKICERKQYSKYFCLQIKATKIERIKEKEKKKRGEKDELLAQNNSEACANLAPNSG